MTLKTILIDLYVPAVYEKIEIQIPLEITIQELISLFKELLFEQFDEPIEINNESVLCIKSPEMICSKTAVINELDISNGSQLILF